MGQVMLITGASSGIGEATARRLAREPGAALVLVARREERLRALAAELAGTRGAGTPDVSSNGNAGPRVSFLAVDLLDDDAPARVLEHVLEHHQRLDLLVNNAGAAWRARFADGGYANVQRTMAINFDAPLRLTEALLPLLRSSAPSAIVNVSSTAGRVARGGSGAYSASKFALAGWSDALYAEEHAHGVHVGLVLPGFISTEGFPQAELTAKPWTRWAVSTPEKAAEAIYDAGIGHRAERYVPRAYGLAAALRVLAPALVRRALTGGGAAVMTTTTRPG
jgi:short-subunit dehydrogenase